MLTASSEQQSAAIVNLTSLTFQESTHFIHHLKSDRPARGKSIFLTKAKCAACHRLPLLADNILHSAAELGIDDFEAMRSPTGMYRTTPLGGLFTRAKGGSYHDGRFATLADVINHYNDHFLLNLTASQKKDLEEYLKSL